jgi:pyruvate formate lyase activating enzyme
MKTNVTYPLVADLKRNSLDDGPGIRTVVFMKGCPLSCVWCQNPETKSSQQQIVYEADKCIGCGECMNACMKGAMEIKEDGSYPVDQEICQLCGKCIDACLAQALHFAGTAYSPEQLYKKLIRDEVFYKNSHGGVTFSGGEPTLHMSYLAEVAQKLKERNILICLETCGFYNRERFNRELLPLIDLVYFDIKIHDRDRHIKYCGVYNDIILENFAALYSSNKVKVLPRIPLIPGITMEESNLLAISDFLRNCRVKEIGLLPYNPLWLSKPQTIGMDREYEQSEWLKKEEKEIIKNIFREFSFKDF